MHTQCSGYPDLAIQSWSPLFYGASCRVGTHFRKPHFRTWAPNAVAFGQDGAFLNNSLDIIGSETSQVVLVVKNSPADAGDTRDAGSIPRSGRSPGVGNGTPLQYSWLERFHGQRSHRAMEFSLPKNSMGRLQSIGPQRVGHTWKNNAYCLTI